MSILVTGAAGFIGSHVTRTLLARGETVLGLDNFSPYYDPVLKFARLKPLRESPGFTFIEADVADRDRILAHDLGDFELVEELLGFRVLDVHDGGSRYVY